MASMRLLMNLVETTSAPTLREAALEGDYFFGRGFDPRLRALIVAHPFTDGDLHCYYGATRWAERLKTLGVAEIELCHGGYVPGDSDGGIAHYWLKVGGAIFDPTASQFGEPEIDERRYHAVSCERLSESSGATLREAPQALL